jgi:hypothetical protein
MMLLLSLSLSSYLLFELYKVVITCFTVTLTSTATLTGLTARFFKYDDSDSEMIYLIYLLYDVSRG